MQGGSSVDAKPALAAQHNVKDSPPRKIHVQPPGSPQFRTPEHNRLHGDGPEDLRHQILRGEIRQYPDAGAFHGRLDKKSVVVNIDAQNRIR
jgi:hypothetical protein